MLKKGIFVSIRTATCKKTKARSVDTLGLLLHAIVHPADIQDCDGGILLLATLFGMYPFLQKLFADGGYQGPEFQNASAKILPHSKLKSLRALITPKDLWYCRPLFGSTDAEKDWENLNRTALAFLRLASIRLMLRKLCDPA